MIGYIAGFKRFKLPEPKALIRHQSTVTLKGIYVKNEAARDEVGRFFAESGLDILVRKV